MAYVIIGIIALITGFVGGYYASAFLKTGKNQQIEITKKWLLWACAQAENALGSATGEMKLAKVYNEFVTELPQAAKVISYDEFTALVKVVLKEFESILNNNEAISNLINGYSFTAEDAIANEVG